MINTLIQVPREENTDVPLNGNFATESLVEPNAPTLRCQKHQEWPLTHNQPRQKKNATREEGLEKKKS